MVKKSKKETLVLIDAHAIIHRAYHALPDFISPNGEPTGALYGLCSMLLSLIQDLSPDYMVACYDLPQKTFRHEAYKEYKAGRSVADEALVRQFSTSRDIFEVFGIPVVDAPGFEADDIIGTLSEKFKNETDYDIIIASGDMDTLSLIDKKRVQVYTLRKGIKDTILYDEDKVHERYGFGPELVVDYKGLRGDPSDNIPGVKGIGEKTATILLQNFQTIENLYEILHDNAQKVQDAGVTPRMVQLLIDQEEEAFFSKTLAQIRLDAPVSVELVLYRETISPEAVREMLQKLSFKSIIKRCEDLGVIPPKENNIKKEEFIFSEKEGADVQLLFWVLHSERPREDVETIARELRCKNITDLKEKLVSLLQKEGVMYVYENIEEPLSSYVTTMSKRGITLDTVYLQKLSKKYHKTLETFRSKIYKEAGEEFNINSPKQLSHILFTVLELPTKGVKKSAGGAYSTKASVLENLALVHPIIPLVERYRELQKLLSTYIDTLPHYVKEDGRIHADFVQDGTTTGRFSSNNPNMQNIPIKTPLGFAIRNAFVAPEGFVLVAADYSQIELRIAAFLSQDDAMIDIFQRGVDVHSAVAAKVYGVDESEVTSTQRRNAKAINFGMLYGMGVRSLAKAIDTDTKEAQNFYNDYFETFPTLLGYLEKVKEGVRKTGYSETLFGRRRYFSAINSKVPFLRAMEERMAINAPVQGTAADIIKLAMIQTEEAVEKQGYSKDAFLVLQIHDELVYEVKESKVKEVSLLIQETMQNVLPDEFTKNKKTVPLSVDVCIGKDWGSMKDQKK
ncbi:MAG: DNA polymerase-1 [Flavobacteriaceae bacterium]|jgi:DNA polymerase-1